MDKCIYCKNKTSNERCTYPVINGLSVCKRHAKSKTSKKWTDTSSDNNSIIKIQSIWRGYMIRKWLRLSGAGVLNRTLCHNAEDIVTFVEKEKQHPLEYFSFYENDKLWWFDIQTILRWSVEHVNILNPYTKQELPIDARKRLRTLYHLRLRKKLSCISNSETKYTIEQSIKLKAVRIIQELTENGFGTDIRLDDLLTLSRLEYWLLINVFLNESILLAIGHMNPLSTRRKYVCWIQDSINNISINLNSIQKLQRIILNTVLAILIDCKDSFPYCFAFVSAMARL
jgi:hypothetical protein